ncbi:unnamed protein product [Spodoptera littoralis]|uniref:Uncharacterized protein n=1 Tax=Spodoptera littoralis TaxID=7109 RepID=A0A9P0IF63_SPOLI|nr:unnamed protein product [Spodoptera littoralis]CAH1644731.1 unnamed protein product [Spodoptera littoralis]
MRAARHPRLSPPARCERYITRSHTRAARSCALRIAISSVCALINGHCIEWPVINVTSSVSVRQRRPSVYSVLLNQLVTTNRKPTSVTYSTYRVRDSVYDPVSLRCPLTY